MILATGASFAKLGLQGEQRFAGKGVSDCASCDGPLLRDKVAVVVGGGDSALQEALTLADHAAKVFILERAASLTGQAIYQERIRRQKVEVRTRSTISAICGGDAVSHVRVKDLATGGEIGPCDISGISVCRPGPEFRAWAWTAASRREWTRDCQFGHADKCAGDLRGRKCQAVRFASRRRSDGRWNGRRDVDRPLSEERRMARRGLIFSARIHQIDSSGRVTE